MKNQSLAAVTDESPLEERHLPPLWRSWSVWSIAALFYLGGFYLRVSPAVMTSELMREFRIGAVELGSLSAFYYYAYVVMQIPTGVLVDSWGARKLLILGSLASAIGIFIFGSTSNFYVACAGRALIGGATAIGWVVTLKLATHWFPIRIFGMLSGLGLCIGNIGALVAQVPLRLLVEHFGWRTVVLASAGFILAFGATAYAVVFNDPADKGYRTYAPATLQRQQHVKVVDLVKGFRRIFSYRNTWLIFFAQGGIVGSLLSFIGLWGVPFLRARFALEPAQAAGVCSVMIVAWAVASPIFGHLSDRLRRRKSIYLTGALIVAGGWPILFFATALPLVAWVAIAAVISFAAGGVVLGFAYAKESVPAQFLGTISGSINIGNMIGPMILQPAIGWMLDRNWSGQMASGARVYDLHAFQMAFFLIVAWSVLTGLLLSFTKETYCNQTE
jgi:sugar phosphate permease